MKEDVEQMTDEELACSCAEGDRSAFEQIVRRYTRPLAEFVAARTSSFADAEDIVQDTLLKAYTNIKQFDPRYTLKTWLFTIAYRLVVSSYRKKRPVGLSLKQAESIEVDSQKESKEISWIWRQARKISEEAFTILWLRYKHNMQTKQIARVMKMTNVGVRVKLHRARRELAAKISQCPSQQRKLDWKRPGKICMEGTK